jgi:hypothetical protein
MPRSKNVILEALTIIVINVLIVMYNYVTNLICVISHKKIATKRN